MEALIEIYKEKEKNIAPLDGQIGLLKNEIDKQLQIVQGLSKTLQERERLVYKLKKENQDLEKFKYVLEFTISEMEKEIEPKDLEIKELKILISKEDDRLKGLNNIQFGLEKTVVQLEKQKLTFSEFVKNQQETLRRINRRIQNLQTKIFSIVQGILDFDFLKQ